MSVETFVTPAALMAAVTDTVSNTATTGAVVASAAPVIAAPLPAGTDEASALAVANCVAHAANFLGVAAAQLGQMAAFAGTIGLCDAAFETVDAANGTQFL